MSGFSRLYAIVDRATLDARGMGVGEFARELREAGVRLVQYRDKRNAPQEVLRAAREIDAAFAGAEVVRVMNDRADLAVLAGWEGVHVGQGDLGVEAVRRVVGPIHRAALPRDEWGTPGPIDWIEHGPSKSGVAGSIPASATRFNPQPSKWKVAGLVGISTHNEEQVRVAIASGPEYVAVGPVFATGSKANPEPVVGLELVRRAREMTELPIVAIGGITLANARSVMDAGADSVAVIGGLWVAGRSVREVARDFLDVLG